MTEPSKTRLDRYPNLYAIVAGTVSGSVTEWPAIRSELVALCDAISEALEMRDRYRKELEAVNNEFGSQTPDWPNAWERVAEIKKYSNEYWRECERLKEELRESTDYAEALRENLEILNDAMLVGGLGHAPTGYGHTRRREIVAALLAKNPNPAGQPTAEASARLATPEASRAGGAGTRTESEIGTGNAPFTFSEPVDSSGGPIGADVAARQWRENAVVPGFDASTRDIHSPFNACQHREYCKALERRCPSQYSAPAITDEWVTAYCKATNRDPRGTWNTMADDDWVSITFFEAAKRELQLALQTCPAQSTKSNGESSAPTTAGNDRS